MKKSLRIIISIMMALALIISCSSEPETASGTLKVDVSSSITKGINPQIDLEAANYKLVVTDSSGNVKPFDIGTMTSAEKSFPAGSYRVKAYAENKDGIVIGESEEKPFTIYPNRTTSVSLNITEKAGDGSITISFDGLDVFPAGTNFSVEFMKGIASSSELESAGSFPLEMDENGIASVTATLANGFYTFGLKSSDEAGSIALIESVRIVNGDELSVSYSYSYTGNGTVTITNNIVKTPSIEVEKSGDELPITLTSTIDNLGDNASYAWYMDGMLLAGANDKDLTITAESDIEAGEHKFVLLVISNTGIVWSSEPIAVTVPSAMRSYDLSKMDLDNGFEIEVGADEDIMLTNVNIADGVVAEITELGSSKGVGNNGNGNSGFFTESGDFMFRPDKNMNAYFNGSDNGKNNNLRLKIKKFKNLQSDFAITAEEYPTTTGLIEEFYYVDFNSKEFEDIDRSQVVILTQGNFHCGYSIIPDQSTRDFNLSDREFDLSDYDAIGIYAYAVSTFQDESDNYYLHILSPKELEEDENITVSDDFGVFKFAGNGNYKVTYTFEGLADYDSMLSAMTTATKQRLRYSNNGEPTENCLMIPECNPSENKISYYISDINGEVLFNYDFQDVDTTQVDVLLEKVPENTEIPIVITEELLKTNPSYSIKADSSEGYFTYATNGVGTIFSPGVSDWPYYQSVTYYPLDTDDPMRNEYYTVYIGKYSGFEVGATLVTFTLNTQGNNPVNIIQDSHLTFDREKNQYVNDKEEPINNYSVSGSQSFNYTYASENYYDGYGNITFGGGTSPGSTIYGLFSNSTVENMEDPSSNAIYSYAFDVRDGNEDKAISITVKELWTEDGITTKILCGFYLGKDENRTYYEDYFLIDYQRSHEWELVDGTLSCTKCHKQVNNLAVVKLPANTSAAVSISGIKNPRTYVGFFINATGFTDYGSNGLINFPPVQVPLYVYLIPPEENSNLIVTDKGNGEYDIKVVYSN